MFFAGLLSPLLESLAQINQLGRPDHKPPLARYSYPLPFPRPLPVFDVGTAFRSFRSSTPALFLSIRCLASFCICIVPPYPLSRTFHAATGGSFFPSVLLSPPPLPFPLYPSPFFSTLLRRLSRLSPILSRVRLPLENKLRPPLTDELVHDRRDALPFFTPASAVSPDADFSFVTPG